VASGSVGNIQSIAMENNGFGVLGFLEMAIFYLVLGLGSLIAVYFVNKIGPQKCMIIGSIFDCLWILVSLIPALKFKYEMSGDLPETDRPFYFTNSFVYLTTIITSMLGGLGESL
jgi:hypothetical protein